MSKREFKVGDEVLVRGVIKFVLNGYVEVDIGMMRPFATILDDITHAPVKDNTVYEYQYLYKIKGDWYEAAGYYKSKKEMTHRDDLKNFGEVEYQRLAHTKRIRK